MNTAHAAQVTTAQLFTAARTQNGYLDVPLPDERLLALYDLLKWGPTSANSSPARFIASCNASAFITVASMPM